MIRPLLLPLVPVYRAGLALRQIREPAQKLQWPVVSVGNVSAGGAGKTPLVIALAQALAHRGVSVDVLSRGYGRRGSGALRVDPHGTADEFGDEPLLIARDAGVPVFVAAERYEAGALAETSQPEAALKGHDFSRAESSLIKEGALAPERCFPALHILDDGFQHRRLAREIDIVLVSRRDLADRLLPAGNLREPLTALHRAHILAIPAEEPELEADLKSMNWTGPIWRLLRQMEVPSFDGPAVAFCGIARPEQFFAGLESVGLRLAARIAFRDHHRYTPRDLKRLARSAQAAGAAALITTEKDRVRLGALTQALPESLPLKTAGLRTEIGDEETVISDLLRQLNFGS